MNNEVIEKIERISGFNFIQRKNLDVVKLSGKIDREHFSEFLKLLAHYGLSFSIYDALYPSMSDPGAYINYSREKSERDAYWSMTLGNHGWSGGLYHVEESIIVIQLHNLWRKHILAEIGIGTGLQLSHYDNISKERNDDLNRMLLQLHNDSGE